MSYVGRKSGRAALISADIPSNLNLLGDYVKIPSATTTERDALTPAVGMLLYNTTIGLLQQYNAVGWQSIDSPPTISSFTYPEGTALDPAGSTTKTLVITGSNFSVGVTVLIDGTAPTSTARNSATQVTITGYPAKAAATYAAGLVVTNASGLSSAVDIIYDAIPAWTTAAGSLGSFVDGAYTNSSASTIRIVAAEGSDTIDYAQVSDAGGGTIITSGVAGLTLGTTGANAGYLTGTLSGDESSTYNLYAKAQDDEGQFSAVRLFNIISRHPYPTGGTITTYSGFRVHTFLSGSTTFTVTGTISVDILIVAGGGGGGRLIGGGGGAGGVIVQAGRSAAAGAYTIYVGAGGAGGTSGSQAGVIGTDSSITFGGSAILLALGGGLGADNSQQGGDGGSGGSQGNSAKTGGAGRQTTASGISADSRTYGFGTKGGDSSTSSSTGGGGGGAGGAGTDGGVGVGSGSAGGAGIHNLYKTGTAGTTIATHYFGGGGGGGAYDGSGVGGGATYGGGAGGAVGAAGTAGTANSGGGGGGGGYNPAGDGGAGGLGIVIIRYAV